MGRIVSEPFEMPRDIGAEIGNILWCDLSAFSMQLVQNLGLVCDRLKHDCISDKLIVDDCLCLIIRVIGSQGATAAKPEMP